MTVQALREKFAADPQRPRYHFLAPNNWMNDPNGLIQWKGRYHLFYQHNPKEPFWGKPGEATMHWGHAVSNELVHWTDLPIALAPTPWGADWDGCWSGCAVDNNGIPTLIYTGVSPEHPCIATSTDDLLTWQKYPGNPVIASPPKDLDVVGFRDHCVWKEGDIWYHIIGSGIKGVGGTALLYKSKNLIHWDYMHPIFIGDKSKTEPIWTGSMWECPSLFPLEGKHVLVVSVCDMDIPYHLGGKGNSYYTAYSIGKYAKHKFMPEPNFPRKLDYGNNQFYAAATMLDDKGRRIMWGWIREGRSDRAQRAAGWAGVMSLPRVLSIHRKGLLGIEPAPELQILRGKHHRFADIDLTPASSNVLKDLRGDCCEIVAEFQPGDAKEFGIKVRCSPDGEEQTLIICNHVSKRLTVDRQRSSLSNEVERDLRGGPLELAASEIIRLHVFLDRSVLEVFVNGWACITERIYPTRLDSLGMDLFAFEGTVKLKSIDVWEMRSIWV